MGEALDTLRVPATEREMMNDERLLKALSALVYLKPKKDDRRKLDVAFADKPEKKAPMKRREKTQSKKKKA